MSISPSPSSNKSACPICGRSKTSWSLKCSTCEGNRQKYLAAVERADADKAFLESLQGRTYQQVASERGVTRQRIQQLKKDAEARVTFLRQHPAPRRAFMQVPA